MSEELIQRSSLTAIGDAIREVHKTDEKIPVAQMPDKIREIPPGFLDTSKIEDWSYFCYNGARNDILQKADVSGGKSFNRVCYGDGDLISLELNCPLATDFQYGFYDCVYLTDLTLHLGDGTNGTNLIRDVDFTNAFRNASSIVNLIISGKILIIGSGTFNVAYSASLSLESVESIAEAVIREDTEYERAIYLPSAVKTKLNNADDPTKWNDEEERIRYANVMDKLAEKRIGLA